YTCVGGKCASVCLTGWGDCDGDPMNGCETRLGSPAHCGNCATACAPGQVCTPNGCAAACPPPLTNCGGSCADLASSVHHCGVCDYDCTIASMHADPLCSSRGCQV